MPPVAARGHQRAAGRPGQASQYQTAASQKRPFCALSALSATSKIFVRSAPISHQDRNDALFLRPFCPSAPPADPPSAGPVLPGLSIHQRFPVLHSFHSHQQRGYADAGGFCPSATLCKPDTLRCCLGAMCKLCKLCGNLPAKRFPWRLHTTFAHFAHWLG